jgi:hypothetical protein
MVVRSAYFQIPLRACLRLVYVTLKAAIGDPPHDFLELRVSQPRLSLQHVPILKENQMQAVVELGGSAGSISPLQAFFSRMPVDSGLVFVVDFISP